MANRFSCVLSTFMLLLTTFSLPLALLQERRKDLTDHREDSTFSFDPTKINVKTLAKEKQKKLDARKGVLLSSYTRKKTRRRRRGRSTAGSGSSGQDKSGSVPSRYTFCHQNTKVEPRDFRKFDKKGKQLFFSPH